MWKSETRTAFFRACHGPALVGQPIIFSCRGPRPGPAHQVFFYGLRPGPARRFFRGLATARPGPSNFFEDGPWPGPAQLVNFFRGWAAARSIEFQVTSARPGPAHDIRSEAHETRASYGPARGFEEPAHGSAHGLAHVSPRTKKCTLTFFYIFVLIMIG